MVVDCDGNLISKDDAVQSLRTKRVYAVLRVKSDGRLVLWKHGWPTRWNANPANWRLFPRREVSDGRA